MIPCTSALWSRSCLLVLAVFALLGVDAPASSLPARSWMNCQATRPERAPRVARLRLGRILARRHHVEHAPASRLQGGAVMHRAGVEHGAQRRQHLHDRLAATDGTVPVAALEDTTVDGVAYPTLQFRTVAGGPVVMLVDPKTADVRSLRYPTDPSPNAPQAREQLDAWGLSPVGSTPEAFGEFVRREMDKYARIAREANIPKQ